VIPVFRPTAGEEEANQVRRVLLSRWIGFGSETLSFEDEFSKHIGARYACATNSGTAALHLALVAAGVKRGDEVILPALTFVSCAHVVRYCGATPVFADVDRKYLTLDPTDLAEKITDKTKAVMAVHYGGNPCDLSRLVRICKKEGIALVEDAAHAAGALYRGRSVGTFGIGCFSFHAVKNLTTGDGGMITTEDKKVHEHLRKLAWLGITKTTWNRYGKTSAKGNWDYGVEEVGFKYHMNDIAAAIGRVQLKKLEASNRHRREIAKSYDESLSSEGWIELPEEREDCYSSYHLYPIRVPERDRLIAQLARKGIATSVHYRPLYHHGPYRRYRTKLSVTDAEWSKLISLPMYPEIEQESLREIISAIKEFGKDQRLR